MATTVIDHSETVSGLQVLSTTDVQHDANSPPGPVVVTTTNLDVGVAATLNINDAQVNTNGITLNALSTVNVVNHGIFELTGAISIGLLSSINIGANSAMVMGSSLGLNALSKINFIGPNAALFVEPAAQGNLLSPSTSGNIAGFAKTDAIDLVGLAGGTHAVWSQNLVQQLLGFGEVQVFNAQNVEIGQISLKGAYKTTDFVVGSDLHGGTIIGHT